MCSQVYVWRFKLELNYYILVNSYMCKLLYNKYLGVKQIIIMHIIIW